MDFFKLLDGFVKIDSWISLSCYIVRRLQSFGELQTFVVGNWGEGSEDLHALVQTCAEARVAHICRSTGRQESEHLLGTIVGQYRRLVSTCAVRAQAMCTLARVGLISPAASTLLLFDPLLSHCQRELRS